MDSTRIFFEHKKIGYITNADVFHSVRFLDSFMANHKGYIAGGCFKNILTGSKLKDIDIFFCQEKDFKEAIEYFKKSSDYNKSYSNKKVKAFKHKKTGILVELIKGVFAKPVDMISDFDFSVTRFAYCKDSEDGGYYMLYSDSFFEHLLTKKLVIDGVLKHPVSTFERSYRYKKYGFGLCRESKEKLITALKGADLDNLSLDLYFGID